MAPNLNGVIIMYSQPPYLPNKGNPSLKVWQPMSGYANPDNVIDVGRALGDTVDAPQWVTSATPFVADFCNELMRFMGNINRDAELVLNKQRKKHPYAFAMRRITKRRAV